MDFLEASINTYSGLSSETKPTAGAGNNVPNGSRWREVDTEDIYFYNKSDDTWYLVGVELSASFDDIEDLLAKRYYKRMKPYAWASARPKYIARNTDIDALEIDADWSIWKYTDADLPEIEGPRTGAVNTEAAINALAWNI